MMRGPLTTRSQNCYREQIQKEMLTRLAWKSRYAKIYPTCSDPQSNITESPQLPRLPADPRNVLITAPLSREVLPPIIRTTGKLSDLPPPPPPSAPPSLAMEGEGRHNVPPLMRPVSPQTRQALYQDSTQHGKGRSLYLQRRGQMRPEEKFDFPLLSSWEYGWRMGDFHLDYRTPSRARSSVVKDTFYARNGVFNSPTSPLP